MARSGGLEDTGPRSEAEIVEIDEGAPHWIRDRR